jgi:hypothetical protein
MVRNPVLIKKMFNLLCNPNPGFRRSIPMSRSQVRSLKIVLPALVAAQPPNRAPAGKCGGKSLILLELADRVLGMKTYLFAALLHPFGWRFFGFLPCLGHRTCSSIAAA